MNRAPSSRDLWWAEHQATCGGTFIKTKEPEGYGKKPKDSEGCGQKRSSKRKRSPVKSRDISTMLNKTSSKPRIAITGARDIVTVTNSASGVSDDEREERRRKLAEAALKRIKDSHKRGEPTSRQSPVRKSPPVPSVVVLPPIAPTTSSSSSSRQSLVNRPSASMPLHSPVLSQGNTNSNAVANSDVIDTTLATDNTDIINTTNTSSDPLILPDITTPTRSGNSLTISLVDDDDIDDGHDHNVTMETRQCPVCGCGDIPFPVINTHIAFCLEEMELESDDE